MTILTAFVLGIFIFIGGLCIYLFLSLFSVGKPQDEYTPPPSPTRDYEAKIQKIFGQYNLPSPQVGDDLDYAIKVMSESLEQLVFLLETEIKKLREALDLEGR